MKYLIICYLSYLQTGKSAVLITDFSVCVFNSFTTSHMALVPNLVFGKQN